MTVTLLAALLAQAVSVTLLRRRLGRHWLRHPVTLVVLAGAVYQGLAPTLLIIPFIARGSISRVGIQPGYADDAALLTSTAMLAFTVGFLATRPERSIRQVSPGGIRAAAMTLDWKWLAAACVPLAVWTFEGRGYNGSQALGSVSTDLAVSFFVISIALASGSILLRFGTRWFIPVLAVQSAILAAAGERTPIITDAITVILMLTLTGHRPRRRQLCAAAAIGLTAILAITGLRAEQGRSLFYQDSGVGARMAALGEGITSVTGTSAGPFPNLAVQVAIRLDGVDWTASILQSVQNGQPRLPASWAAESLLIVVPKSLWAAKLSRGTLAPALLEQQTFGIQVVNLLPTLPGLYAGYFSPLWLELILGFLGVLCGRGERWLFRRCTSVRVVMLAGAAIAALGYESGLSMLIDLRSAAIIAAAVKVIEVARRPHPAGRTVPGVLTGSR